MGFGASLGGMGYASVGMDNAADAENRRIANQQQQNESAMKMRVMQEQDAAAKAARSRSDEYAKTMGANMQPLPDATPGTSVGAPATQQPATTSTSAVPDVPKTSGQWGGEGNSVPVKVGPEVSGNASNLAAMKLAREQEQAKLETLRKSPEYSAKGAQPNYDNAVGWADENYLSVDNGGSNQINPTIPKEKAHLARLADLDTQIKAAGGQQGSTTRDVNSPVMAGVRPSSGASAGAPATSGAQPPLNVRNNNPGNIKDPKSGQFAQYESPELGFAAMAKQLQLYGQRGNNTLNGIISTWAPKGDGNNDPTAYAVTVAKALGVDPAQPLNLNDPKVLGPLMQAMSTVEGKNGFTAQQIQSGMQLAAQGAPIIPQGGQGTATPGAPGVTTAAPPPPNTPAPFMANGPTSVQGGPSIDRSAENFASTANLLKMRVMNAYDPKEKDAALLQLHSHMLSGQDMQLQQLQQQAMRNPAALNQLVGLFAGQSNMNFAVQQDGKGNARLVNPDGSPVQGELGQPMPVSTLAANLGGHLRQDIRQQQAALSTLYQQSYYKEKGVADAKQPGEERLQGMKNEGMMASTAMHGENAVNVAMIRALEQSKAQGMPVNTPDGSGTILWNHDGTAVYQGFPKVDTRGIPTTPPPQTLQQGHPLLMQAQQMGVVTANTGGGPRG